MIDGDRSAVYSAEDQWSAALDRGGPIDFFGSHLVLPIQLRFGDLAAMQSYVDACHARFPTVGPVFVRPRRGQAKAHYVDGVIAIPMDVTWACRESVLLHEFAHHLHASAGPESFDGAPHGARYRRVMLELVGIMLGPEAALLLRSSYDANGVGAGVD